MSTNPFAFADSFKSLFDVNQILDTQRRNLEALATINQGMVECAQAISRRQAETAQASVQALLKTSRDVVSSGTPEAGLAKQAELTKKICEQGVINFREASEMLAKSGFEAFDLLNKRATEALSEVSRQAASSKRKSA
jgi:phasin family protein